MTAIEKRYDGGCEKIAGNIDVARMVAWISSISLEDWPQQTKHFGEMRPAMVNILEWNWFGSRATEFINTYFSQVKWRNPMLSVIMPDHFIHSHVDEQPVDWLYRVHVPLTTNRLCSIIIDRVYHLEVGSAYKVNTEHRHAIVNLGKTPRIHFMFDVYSQ